METSLTYIQSAQYSMQVCGRYWAIYSTGKDIQPETNMPEQKQGPGAPDFGLIYTVEIVMAIKARLVCHYLHKKVTLYSLLHSILATLTPFEIRFLSNNYETMAESVQTTTKGFKLNYFMDASECT